MSVIAAVQMCSGDSVADNIGRAAALAREAVSRGAGIVVLPENFTLMAATDRQRQEAAEDEDGPTRRRLAELARSLGVHLVAGSIPLRGRERLRSSCLVFGPDGQVLARYDKRHLFDVDVGDGESYRESAYIEPGDDIVTVTVGEAVVGLSVCYDVRFPEHYRRLSAMGANVLTVPSAFTVPTGRAHWETMLRARAIENLAYVVAPAQFGAHPGGRRTYGHTMIVGPWGDVLGHLAEGEGVVCVDCPFDAMEALRKRFPVLDHRRDGFVDDG
jgi:nitrilase